MDPARVVDRDVADQVDQPGLGVDLDDREVGAERVGGVRRLEVVLAGQAALEALGSRDGSFAAVASSAHGIARGGRARDAEALAGDDLDVAGVGLEQVRGQPPALLEHLVGGLLHRGAADLQRARAHRAHAALDRLVSDWMTLTSAAGCRACR